MIADWEWIRGELKDAEAGHRGITTYLGVNIFNWHQGCSAVSHLLQDLDMLNGNSNSPMRAKVYHLGHNREMLGLSPENFDLKQKEIYPL